MQVWRALHSPLGERSFSQRARAGCWHSEHHATVELCRTVNKPYMAPPRVCAAGDAHSGSFPGVSCLKAAAYICLDYQRHCMHGLLSRAPHVGARSGWWEKPCSRRGAALNVLRAAVFRESAAVVTFLSWA